MAKWANFLIQFGYRWPAKGPNDRRISLVSMPCDSPGAGLVTLGLMIRDLENPNANEIEGHVDRLVAHSMQYLQHCGRCRLDKCDPSIQQCGLIKKLPGSFRSTREQFHGVRFAIKKMSGDPDCPIWILADRRRGGGNNAPTREQLRQYYLDGGSPIETPPEGTALSLAILGGFIPESRLFAENLRRSYSNVCFAGRSAGATQTRAVCESISFRIDSDQQSLADLLSVREWSAKGISRVLFFNSLKGCFDRNASSPSVVVADGDGSFLKALACPDFQHSDIIGVVHRTIDREKLEALGNKMVQLGQWYSPDEDTLCLLPSLLLGISVAILRRRTE